MSTLPDVVGQIVVVHGDGLGHAEVGTGSVGTRLSEGGGGGGGGGEGNTW